jgi:hypothetical protein
MQAALAAWPTKGASMPDISIRANANQRRSGFTSDEGLFRDN